MDQANGTIVEQALIATKNLESAIYKRASISPVELEAIQMLIQCADELRGHIEGKRVDSTRKTALRELRTGLKREHTERITTGKSERYAVSREDDTIVDYVKRQMWGYDDNDRLELVRQWV